MEGGECSEAVEKSEPEWCAAVEQGCVNTIRQLNSSVLQTVDGKGRTPAHLAADKGNADALRCLFELVPGTLSAMDNKGRTPTHLAANKEELVLCLEELGFPIYLGSEQIVAGGQVQLSDKVLMGQDGRIARGDIMRIARRAGLVDTMLGGASSICDKAQEILGDWLRCALKDTISRISSPSNNSQKHYITAGEMTQTLRDQGKIPIGWGGRSGPVWSKYIALVLKQVHPNMRMSEISTTVMDDLVCLTLGKVVTGANDLRELSLPPLPPAGILCRDLTETQLDQLNERFPRIVHEKDHSVFTRCTCGDDPCAAIRAAATVPVRMAQDSRVNTDKRSCLFGPRGVEASLELPWEDVFDPSHRTKIVDVEHLQERVRAVFPGELAKHAVSEGSKAVTKFRSPCRVKPDPVRAAKAGLQFSVEMTAAATDYMYATVLTENAAVYMAAVLEYIAAEALELGGNKQRDTVGGKQYSDVHASRSDKVEEWNSLVVSEDQSEMLDVQLDANHLVREYPRREEEEDDDKYNKSRRMTLHAQDIQLAISSDNELCELFGHMELVIRNGLFIRNALWETEKRLAAKQETGNDDNDNNKEAAAEVRCFEAAFRLLYRVICTVS